MQTISSGNSAMKAMAGIMAAHQCGAAIMAVAAMVIVTRMYKRHGM